MRKRVERADCVCVCNKEDVASNVVFEGVCVGVGLGGRNGSYLVQFTVFFLFFCFKPFKRMHGHGGAVLQLHRSNWSG